jgi:hypothetical protein
MGRKAHPVHGTRESMAERGIEMLREVGYCVDV